MTGLRLGLSGCGRRGAEVVAAVRTHGECEVAALHDPDAAARDRLAASAGIPIATAEFDRLLATGVDFVVLTGPCGDRLPQVEAAAAQGAHCLLHAPMAVDAAIAARMVAACDAAGVKLGVAVPAQADPTFEQLRRMIADDWLGAPIMVASLVGDDAAMRSPAPDGHWRRDPHRTGEGPLLQLATEHLHLATWLCERQPTRATGVASAGFTQLSADSAAAALLLRGGVVCTFAASHLCSGSALAIHGTDGAIRIAQDRLWLHGRKTFAGEMFDYHTPHAELLLPVGIGRDSDVEQWNRCELHGRFARWIDDCDDFPCPGEQAAQDLRAFDAVRAAIARNDGEPV